MFGTITTNLSYLLIREWLNGGLFPLSFMLALVLAIFLIHTYRVVGRGWTKMDGVGTASILLCIFMADATRAGLVWFTYRVQNDGGTLPKWLADFTSILFIVTAVMLIFGIIKAIHKFTPKWLGHTYWVASVFITIIFLMVSHMAPPFHFN